MYKFLIAKRMLESLIMFPFVALGRLWASFDKRREDFEIYFFFPFYHIGGAEKVHYQIAQAFTGKKCIIYFTRKSIGGNFLKEFYKAGFIIKDISRFTDNKYIYPVNFIFRGIISYRINRQKSESLVFNGQSNFGYKISPWISKKNPQIDLIHALCSFSKIRVPYLQFYKTSMTVSKEIIDKHEQLYNKYKVPSIIKKNIQFINYGIELPERIEKSNHTKELNILYVGRGSDEKRIHLIAEIAKQVHELGLNHRFNFLGDVESFIPADLKQFCNLYGTITDNEQVDNIYRQNNVLLVTSYTESGPLVVMEAMARGLCILSTPVGIVNEHVISGRNGFVFSSVDDEDLIISEAVLFINRLSKNIELQKSIAQENVEYSYANFNVNLFYEKYRKLFKNLNPVL